MSIPLLHTKFYIPTPRPNLVRRPRLVARLDAGLRGKMTLLSAPPGFGKSTLLSEWIRDGNLRASWLSLDEQDNDPVRFLTYLIGAIQTTVDDIGEKSLTLLQAQPPPSLESILTTLINDCLYVLESDSVTRPPLVLVLDDYHLITSRAVHELVNFLLNYLPRQIHLVIATRDDPDLPLARFRVQAELNELRASDLRFRTKEIADFFLKALGLAITEDDLSVIEFRTEGWIAGLQVAALSMKGRDDYSHFIQSFAGDNRYILDYLGEEVLDNIPHEDRDFLLKTAILDRLSGPLCDFITGGSNGQETLERLERSNLFLIRLDGTHSWYRYHHLFAEFLRSLLESTDPDLVQRLNRKAAQWFGRNNLPDEAIMHAITAQDYSTAEKLIGRFAKDKALRGETGTLQLWLDRLPPTVVNESPGLSLAQAWAVLFSSPSELTETWLQRSEARLKKNCHTPDQDAIDSLDGETRTRLGEINTIRARLASTSGDTQRTIELGHQALKLLPEEYLDLRAANMMAIGYAYRYNGEIDQARSAFSEGTNLSKETGNLFQELDGLCNLANLQMMAGELRQAHETAQEALKIATRKETPSSILGEVFLVFGVLLYEGNDLDEAWQYIQRSIDLCQQTEMTELLYAAYLWLAEVHRAQANFVEAKNAMSLAIKTAQRTDNWRVIAHAEAAQVRLFLHTGDLPSAITWVDDFESLNIERPISLPLLKEYQVITLARVYFAQGDYKKVLGLLEPMLRQVETAGRNFHLYNMMVLLAITKSASGDSAGALDTIKMLLSQTSEKGYIRLYLDAGKPMADLLRRAFANGISPLYTQKLLNAFTHEPDSENSDASLELAKPLSRRELQVLDLVSNGLSNREVADELVITVGTTKRHVVNIFRKLGVSNRTQAVARARKLELID